jgi:2-phosphosulfolactate phosphatase
VDLHVAFLPRDAGALGGATAVVVDVLRATTSLVVMLERGCEEVVIAPSLEAARAYRGGHPDALLAGEEGGRAPQGFDFGNSPAAFAGAALRGRRVVFATTNGTAAIHAVRGAEAVLMGCLRNRSAAARAALEAGGEAVCVVCAGREGVFSLDDAFAAGAIVEAMIAQARGLSLSDGAEAARRLYTGGGDPLVLFRRTRGGRHLVEIGLAGDLEYCAAVDRSMLVPRLGARVRVMDE